MNILVVNGSPRKGGNSEILTDAFIEGALEKHHIIRTIDAGHSHIEPCRACYECRYNGGNCCVQDDMQGFYKDLEWAELLVFSFPLYWFTCTAQIKAFIDRMFCITGGHPFGVSKVAMICPFEDTIDKADGLVQSFKLYADYIDFEIAGIVLAPGTNLLGEAHNSPALEEARQLGLSLE